MSVVKAKTAAHAARLDMHAGRITDVEESLGSHVAAMYVELSKKNERIDDLTEHLDELTEIVSVLVSAVHKLMRLSDEMDADFNGRLSFLEVISE